MGAVSRRSPTVSLGFGPVGSCSRIEVVRHPSIVTGVGLVVAGLGPVVAGLGRLLVCFGCLVPVIGDPIPVIAGLARGLGTTVVIPCTPSLIIGHETMLPHLGGLNPAPRHAFLEGGLSRRARVKHCGLWGHLRGRGASGLQDRRPREANLGFDPSARARRSFCHAIRNCRHHSFTTGKSEVERAEQEDDADVGCKPLPKPSLVPEEQEVHAHHDGDHG